jgi:hypothetical protein
MKRVSKRADGGEELTEQRVVVRAFLEQVSALGQEDVTQIVHHLPQALAIGIAGQVRVLAACVCRYGGVPADSATCVCRYGGVPADSVAWTPGHMGLIARASLCHTQPLLTEVSLNNGRVQYEQKTRK